MFSVFNFIFNKKSEDATPFFQKAAEARDSVSSAIERSGLFNKGSMNISLPSNHSQHTTALSIYQPIFQQTRKDKILDLWKLITQQPLKVSFESSRQSNAVGFYTGPSDASQHHVLACAALPKPPLVTQEILPHVSTASTSLPKLDHPISQHSPFSFFSWFNKKAPVPTKFLPDELNRHLPGAEELAKMWNATQASTPVPAKFLADEFSRDCPAKEEIAKMWNATQASTPGPTKFLADEFSRDCPAKEEIAKKWNGVVQNSTKDAQLAISQSYSPWIIGGLVTIAAGCWLYKKYFSENPQEKQDLTAEFAEFRKGLQENIARLEADGSSVTSEPALEIANPEKKEALVQESCTLGITCSEKDPINNSNTFNPVKKEQSLNSASVSLKKFLNFIVVIMNTLRSIFDFDFLDTKRKCKSSFDFV